MTAEIRVDEKCSLPVRLKPQAKRNSVTIGSDGLVVLAVTSPPVDGRANEHALKLLSKALRVPKSSCTIVRGQTSRNKLIEIEGISKQAALALLASKHAI